MWTVLYNVAMQTPIGARYGSMVIAADGCTIKGTLTILKKETSFHGILKEDGNCTIEGQLTTLMRSIPYRAAGWVTKEALWFLLSGDQETFELSGSAAAYLPPAKKESSL